MPYTRQGGSSVIEVSSAIRNFPVKNTIVQNNQIGETVVLPAYTGKIIACYIDVVINCIQNTSGAGTNYLDGDQDYKMSPDGVNYYTCGKFEGDMFNVGASGSAQERAFGMFRINGNTDVKAYLTSASIIVNWINSKSARDDLYIYGCYPIIRIYFL